MLGIDPFKGTEEKVNIPFLLTEMSTARGTRIQSTPQRCDARCLCTGHTDLNEAPEHEYEVIEY